MYRVNYVGERKIGRSGYTSLSLKQTKYGKIRKKFDSNVSTNKTFTAWAEDVLYKEASQKSIDDIDFEKSGGLIPIIVQDATTKDVLTLAYSNKESLELTNKTGNSWFWSRSRNKLWMKGEESGNTQKIKEILVDCDSDAIIYLVEPSGPACHTGERVCFHNNLGK